MDRAEHTEELVWAESEDGGELEGVLLQPTTSPPHELAVLWLHGLGSRFANKRHIAVGRRLASQGLRVLMTNNRGHDIANNLRLNNGEYKLAGAIWELLEESPLDVGGWLAFCAERGLSRVVLVGHSLGAVKVAYYQALRQDARVVGLVTASPPMRSAPADPTYVQLAEQLLRDGKGTDLLPWGSFPVGAGTLSAQTALSYLRHFPGVFAAQNGAPAQITELRCHLLTLFGTDEEWIGGQPELEYIRNTAVNVRSLATHLIEGADHSYSGHEHTVADVIGGWVRSLPV